MKLIRPIDFQNVEELSRRLRTGRPSIARFSIEIPAKDAANGIYCAARCEVERVGGKFAMGPELKANIYKCAEWLTSPEASPGLMLMGLTGNGKTSVARGIANLIEWITNDQLGYSKRIVVGFYSGKEVCRMCAISPKDYEKLFAEEIIVLDDLGEEPKEVLRYGMINTPVVDLILERYQRRRMTIVTTNLQASELSDKYGERVADRFREMMTTVVFRGESYRRARTKGN